jgi:argininosuccinate lyase
LSERVDEMKNSRSRKKKVRSGRFEKSPHLLFEAFSESISFDRRLALYDVAGSIAHVRMLKKQKIIKGGEAGKIEQGLRAIERELHAGKFPYRMEYEDIHMNIEARLFDKAGSVAGKLHTARSRNDQVAVDMRLYLRDECLGLMRLVGDLCRALVELADANMGAIMPGYTHTRKAQPVLFSHQVLAYVEMFIRDMSRLGDAFPRINVLPLGSGALAGVTFPVNRKFLADELGFSSISNNSIDAVSDRDFIIELASAGAMIMMHLSRLSEDLILFSAEEFGFIELDQAFCSGSSMMPNKMNPDSLELIRGKTGRVYGTLLSLLTVMKGLPLAYNRDMQEDKEVLFDALDTLKMCLHIAITMLASIRVDPERMAEAARKGFTTATDLADYLARKGIPFRKSHEVVGRVVRHCEKKGLTFDDLTLKDLRKFHTAFGPDAMKVIKIENAVKARNSAGGTSPRQVRRQIIALKKKLGL